MRARSHLIVLLPLMLLAWVASGCVMPAGSSLDATVIAQALPSFTPPATDIPIPPTDTPESLVAQAPTDDVVPTATPTPDIVFGFVTATLTPQVVAVLPTDTPIPTETPQVVVVLPNNEVQQQLEPIWQTATAIFLLQNPGFGQEDPVIIIDPFDGNQQPGFPTPIDPNLQTATQLILEFEQTQSAPLTQTMAAIIGASPTSGIIFATATLEPTSPFPFPTSDPGFPPQIIPGGYCVHEVRRGENLFRIGLRYGIPYQDLARDPNNSIANPNLIYVLQRIFVPQTNAGCGTTGAIPPATSTPTPSFSVQPPIGGGQLYTVRQGDTLFRISLNFNVPIDRIVAANPQIVNISLIYIGQEIVIPS